MGYLVTNTCGNYWCRYLVLAFLFRITRLIWDSSDCVGRLTKLNKQKRETDYRVFFILGICLMGLGISLMLTVGPAFLGFLGSGVVFMVIGLANRDKWAKSKKETLIENR